LQAALLPKRSWYLCLLLAAPVIRQLAKTKAIASPTGSVVLFDRCFIKLRENECISGLITPVLKIFLKNTLTSSYKAKNRP